MTEVTAAGVEEADDTLVQSPIDLSPASVRTPLVPLVDLTRCTACGRCAEACTPRAIVVRQPAAGRRALIVIDSARCTYCTDCESACPEAAIECPFEIREDADPGYARALSERRSADSPVLDWPPLVGM